MWELINCIVDKGICESWYRYIEVIIPKINCIVDKGIYIIRVE